MSQMTPREIVQELDKHIIGQDAAKRAVAIALRNRWRRSAVDDPLRQEITPKNILMIGPTGVGKTEIARRLAKLVNAPFVKVEASKFTEVGYVGREVDSIIRDLADVSLKLAREREVARLRHRAEDAAEERVLDALLPGSSSRQSFDEAADAAPNETRQKFRKMLREGKLDEREIEIDVAVAPANLNIMTPPGMEELSGQIQNMFQGLNQQQRKSRRVTVSEAMKLLTEDEAGRMINEDELRAHAVDAVEQSGIV
ncbi:MAG: AAA family ATPase, partial [Pseudomonadota bacterium]